MENKRIVDINIYWAEIVRDTAQFGQIAVAENPEFNRLSECIFRALEDSFIHSATEYGVSRWEKMLQIAPSSTDTLDDRKARVLTYLNLKLPYTWRVLKQLVEGVVGDEEYDITLNNDTQTLYIQIPASYLDAVQELVGRVIPMNLAVEYDTYGLPAGYMAAEFLTAESTFITVPLACDLSKDSFRIETGTTAVQCTQVMHAEGSPLVSMGEWTPAIYMVDVNGGVTNGALTVGSYYDFWLEFTVTGFKFGSSAATEKEVIKTVARKFTEYNLFARSADLIAGIWNGHKKYWKAWKNGELLFDLIPTITPMGEPAFYNKVDGAVYGNSYTGTLTIGMTLSQARKLANLPDGGGTLKISLPSNYTEDESVSKALQAAEAKGWIIEIQTHEAEASEASTFALRRIWVKRTQHEHGMYVAQDGTRWNVEWCVDIIGADPQERGYELFRSVDAAVDYWELTQYEELLTEEGVEQ